jgi:hypothetical protein
MEDDGIQAGGAAQGAAAGFCAICGSQPWLQSRDNAGVITGRELEKGRAGDGFLIAEDMLDSPMTPKQRVTTENPTTRFRKRKFTNPSQ